VKFLLRQLPFFETETSVAAPDEEVTVRAYQIVAWASLSAREVLDPDASRFPVILDTATNHNFAIQEAHLERWAGLSLRDLPQLGRVFLGEQELPLVRASAWLHPNRAGRRDEFAQRSSFRMEMPQGMIVFPRGLATSARLPLLGMRSLVRNQLHLAIDGSKLRASLRTTR